MVLDLTFKSLIHFELNVSGIRRWSPFIFLHVFVQFSQHHLLNKLSLAHCICCFLCQILIDYKGVSLFLGSLSCSTDLCVCFYASTMLFWLLWPFSIFDIRKHDSSNFVLLSCDSCCYAGPFVVSCKFLKCLFFFVKYVIGILMAIALSLQSGLGSMDVLVMSILPIHEHGMCFHLCIFFYFFIQCPIIFQVQYFTSLVAFIPQYFILFVAIMNGTVFLISLSVHY